jgi:hypothetical protein
VALTSMEMPVRIPQTRIVACPREFLSGLKCQILTTSCALPAIKLGKVMVHSKAEKAYWLELAVRP